MMTYNLQNLAIELNELDRHSDLVKQIRRAYTVASAATDLLRVIDYLNIIKRVQVHGAMPADFSRGEGGALINGLFIASVIVYARATVVAPIARDAWWSPDKLSKAHKETHDLSIGLRNKEFAHFGTGLNVGNEPLVREVLYFSSEGHSPINFHASSWATRPEFVLELLDLTNEVYRTAGDRMEAAFRRVWKHLQMAIKDDPELKSIISKHPVIDVAVGDIPEDAKSESGDRVTGNWTTLFSRAI